jgi:hypothetical protein
MSYGGFQSLNFYPFVSFLPLSASYIRDLFDVWNFTQTWGNQKISSFNLIEIFAIQIFIEKRKRPDRMHKILVDANIVSVYSCRMSVQISPINKRVSLSMLVINGTSCERVRKSKSLFKARSRLTLTRREWRLNSCKKLSTDWST